MLVAVPFCHWPYYNHNDMVDKADLDSCLRMLPPIHLHDDLLVFCRVLSRLLSVFR